MGNDGGDIPGRKELVKEKKKVEVANAQSIAIGRSRFCNLTHQRLKVPLAVCRLGYIYNFQNLLSALVKKQLPEKYSYIKKLADIKQVIIERAGEDSDNFIACPITKLEYNGYNKFVTIWRCGHVLSRKAFKEIKEEGNKCVVCLQHYDNQDIIDMNLEGEQLEHMRRRLIEKKKKKEKRVEEKSQLQTMDALKKKGKTDDIYISKADQLNGEFRDVIRDRKNFKDIFQKQDHDEWKVNTYFADKIEQTDKILKKQQGSIKEQRANK